MQSGNNPVLNHYRKTSAEIVSEAKNMLAGGGGARLVSTRRPITPREPRRQLYGRIAPPGRPPSAFSLRYLQFESRALPSLEPIGTPASPLIVHRSESAESILETNNGVMGNGIKFNAKLPALHLAPPKMTASLDNLFDNTNEVVQQQPSTSTTNESINNNKNAVSIEIPNKTTSNKKSSIVKDHPLKKRQTKSMEDKGKKSPSPPPHQAQAKPSLPPPTLTSSSLNKTTTTSTTTTSSKNSVNDLNTINNKKLIKSKTLKNIEAINVSTNSSSNIATTITTTTTATSTTASVTETTKSTNSTIPKTKLARSNDLLSQSSTETLLDMLKGHAGIKECTEETVILINGILTELYTRVKGARGNWRGAVLGALYGLVECASAKVLLAVARVVLALCVTGSNLTGVCKLVFKVARNEINDHLFSESDVPELLIDGLGRANPIEEPEACIYGYGAVRFLASANTSQSNPVNKTTIKPPKDAQQPKVKTLAARLARRGAIQLMILHLQILNEYGSQNTLTGPPLHALYQLSGALRALASVPLNVTNSTRSQILTQNPNNVFPQIREITQTEDNIQLELAGPHLVRAAEICIGETEVQGNIIRTLSILSEIDICCENLLDATARIGILLGPIEKSSAFPEKPLGVISRLGYILGNIMARHDDARTQFFNNDVAMEYLLATLEHFSNKKFSNNSVTPQADTIVDVLIKLVRIIANMAVNCEVGISLGTKPPLGGIFLNILLGANNLKGKMNSDMEELLLATLCALHNLCFYQNAQNPQSSYHSGSVIERQADLSSALSNVLNTGPAIAKTEAARVLGNMTRSLVAREALFSANGMKILVKCLESDDIELVATSCGVLVNLLSDWERRAPFRELRGPQILRDVLQKAALQEDWLLSGIVCQALWNFLIDTSNVIAALGENEADFIQGDLAEYLDEEKIFNGQQPDEVWEQFAMVATDLLERIQSCISITNSPCISSEDEDLQIGEVGDAWGDKFKRWLAE